MNSKRAVTLMELLVVIVIIGILTTIALTNHSAQIEKAIGREGEYNLNLLYNAQKRYRLNNGEYFPNDMFNQVNNIAVINTNLKVMISEKNFNFSISGWTQSNSAQFTVTAIRRGGRLCDGRIMTVTQEGNTVDTSDCLFW